MVVTPVGERVETVRPDWTTVSAGRVEPGDRVVWVVVWDERSRKVQATVSLLRGSREWVSEIRTVPF